MARPLKIGLDYFPLDVSFDDNIELLEAEEGLEGFAILIKLWQKIYSNGYYIEWNDDCLLLFCKKINTEKTKVDSVINTCLRRNLFDKNLFNKYKILTSCGIQKRFISASSQSKRKSISVIYDYMLVNEEFKQLITEFIQLTQEESTQSKVKESKVKEIKVNDNILEIKKSNFKNWSVEDFQDDIKENRAAYPDKDLWSFFNYWSEKDSKDKMKFQLQKTWETQKRLVTWMNNNTKFTPINKNQTQKHEMGDALKESLIFQLNKIKAQ